jgi:hypothetical protein
MIATRETRLLRIANESLKMAVKAASSSKYIDEKSRTLFTYFLGKSERYYNIVIAESPKNFIPYNNRAIVHEMNENYEKAFLDFEMAKRLGMDKALADQNSVRVVERISVPRQKILLESIQKI